MKIEKISYSAIPQISQRDLAYIQEIDSLKDFYKYPVSLEAFKDVIADRKNYPVFREVLVDVLKEQYASVLHDEQVAVNIDKLGKVNTFTLVTAHQPSLFTGPLYFVYKIASLISLVRKLNNQYTDYNFVPVFISSGEDHDFQEVNHIHLFNKTLRWESGESGAVGRMSTKSLRPVLEELKELLGNSESALEIMDIIERTHTDAECFAEAIFRMVNELFGSFGLVVLNADHPALKKLLTPIILQDIFDNSSHKIVNNTIEQLEKAGFAPQATPRDINFFYLADQVRERIVEENGLYKVLNTAICFTKAELTSEIERHPERFSPNVIMRPIYQETILPNLAYLGGGGEIAYWLERKSQFEHLELNFPMLIRRDSALWIDASGAKRMDKLNISLSDLMAEETVLIKKYIQSHASSEIQLDIEKKSLEQVFAAIAQKTKAIDPTLEKTVLAELSKTLKSVEAIETRLMRSEKQKHDTTIQQLRNLKEKFFPGNGLQERHDNFLPIYLKHHRGFFEILVENFNPIEKVFTVFWDE
jgi:bacillithiol biosynthesis cysteine-adding enzyme BshC